MVPESLFGLSSTQIKKKCGLTISDYNILNEIKNNSTPFLQQMITLSYIHAWFVTDELPDDIYVVARHSGEITGVLG